jgi:hypothetical protein
MCGALLLRFINCPLASTSHVLVTSEQSHNVYSKIPEQVLTRWRGEKFPLPLPAENRIPVVWPVALSATILAELPLP